MALFIALPAGVHDIQQLEIYTTQCQCQCSQIAVTHHFESRLTLLSDGDHLVLK